MLRLQVNTSRALVITFNILALSACHSKLNFKFTKDIKSMYKFFVLIEELYTPSNKRHKYTQICIQKGTKREIY